MGADSIFQRLSEGFQAVLTANGSTSIRSLGDRTGDDTDNSICSAAESMLQQVCIGIVPERPERPLGEPPRSGVQVGASRNSEFGSRPIQDLQRSSGEPRHAVIAMNKHVRK